MASNYFLAFSALNFAHRALAAAEILAFAAALNLRLADVLALEVGSVLPLDVTPDAGVTVCVNSVPIHRARPG